MQVMKVRCAEACLACITYITFITSITFRNSVLARYYIDTSSVNLNIPKRPLAVIP
jgi:hypothetical protein